MTKIPDEVEVPARTLDVVDQTVHDNLLALAAALSLLDPIAKVNFTRVMKTVYDFGGLNQGDIASGCGSLQNTVSRWIKGETCPPMHSRKHIVDAVIDLLIKKAEAMRGGG